MPSLVLTKTWRSDQPLKPIARVTGGPNSLDGALLCCSDAAGDAAITLPHDAHMSPCEPTQDPAGRDCTFVAGPSGAGKSTVARGFAERYRALWPRRPIVLISRLSDDDSLQCGGLVDMKRIKIE